MACFLLDAGNDADRGYCQRYGKDDLEGGGDVVPFRCSASESVIKFFES